MQLTAREDVEAPAAAVFAALQDYESFERAAVRRGAEVRRGGSPIRPEWTIAFDFRGKRRKLTVYQAVAEPPTRLVLRGGGKLFEGDMTIELVALARRRTRVALSLDIRPLTLPARILLQSAQLARGRIVRRLQARMTELARYLEAVAKPTDAR
jgi:carbon monoxide dehydrogenase subunit G